MTAQMHNITNTFVSLNTQALSEEVASKIISTFQKITLSRVLLTLLLQCQILQCFVLKWFVVFRFALDETVLTIVSLQCYKTVRFSSHYRRIKFS